MEPVSGRSVLIAVDTNVLLDLAGDAEDGLDCFRLVRQRLPARRLVMPPTVAHELAYEARRAETPMLRARGLRAFQQAQVHDSRPVDLVAVRHGIAEEVGRRLRSAGLLPESEVNDGLVLGEAALLRCVILLTSDRHLRDIPHERLTLELHALDLPAPLVATPRELVRKFLPI